MTNVRVTGPFGETTFARADADVFDPDVLTVSWADPDHDRQYGPAEVFKPGTWIEFTVFDATGHPVKSGLSTLGQQRADAWRQQRRAS